MLFNIHKNRFYFWLETAINFQYNYNSAMSTGAKNLQNWKNLSIHLSN